MVDGQGRYLVLPADLSRIEDIETVGRRLRAEPRLGLLVNNAGFGTKGRFWETAFDEQVSMHRVHIDATMRLTHAALHGMVARDFNADGKVDLAIANANATAVINTVSMRNCVTRFFLADPMLFRIPTSFARCCD